MFLINFYRKIPVEKSFCKVPALHSLFSGIEGFEPSIFRIKNESLTIWPYPNNIQMYVLIFLFQPHVPVRLPCYDFIPVMNFIIISKKINP